MKSTKIFQEIASALGFFLPSCITRPLFRLLGHKIGNNVRLPFFSYIYANTITLGNDVDIRPLVFIRVGALSIGADSIVSFGTQIKGAKSFSTKGNNMIGIYCLINCDENVTLGFYTGLGPRSMVYTHGSFLPVTMGYPAKFEEVVFEDYVWSGMGIIVLPGTHVESNCIINPGVVLKSRIRSNSFLELKPNIISEKNLSRLQVILSKRFSNPLKKILTNFFAFCEIDYTENAGENSFNAGDTHHFKYFEDKKKIELVYSNNKRITYDLENFSTDYSSLEIHKEFLLFLRRRCGIILRTNYDD